MLRAVDIGQVAQHAARHRPHAALQEHVRRTGDTHRGELFYRFISEGGVALHNPGRNFCVAFPGGVLHHLPAVFLRGLHGKADGVVVVHVGDDTLGAEAQNGINPLLCGTFRHIDNGVLA